MGFLLHVPAALCEVRSIVDRHAAARAL